MLRNHLKTALRDLIKNKFYSGINVIGLAVGLATCLLILVYVLDETSYDKFNVKADRIYRLNEEIRFGQNYGDGAQVPPMMGPEIAHEFPQVEKYTRLRWYGALLVKKGKDNLREDRVAYADSTLFDVFSLPVISGDPRTALTAPHTMVISASTAKKYFGRTDVAGRTLTVDNKENYTVTAVISDIPEQCHFHFDIFLPFTQYEDSRSNEWLSENYNTYILLRPGTDVAAVTRGINDMNDRFIGPELKSIIHQDLAGFRKSGSFVKVSLTPLTDIHLHSNKEGELFPNGNIQFVHIFASVAIFILLIACVNFMNLATARASNRAREVGVRKVLGSLRKDLISQFLVESLLISAIALALAVGIAALALPYFDQIASKKILFSELFQPSMLCSLLGLVIVVGLLAGSYPAFVLSAFKPAEVLKGKIAMGMKNSRLKNALVVFQFVVSIVLVIATIVIYSQLNYIRSRDIGFDRNQVLVLNNTGSLGARSQAFSTELARLSGVRSVSRSGFLPTNFARNNNAFFISPTLDQAGSISMQSWSVDEQYIPTLGMSLSQGRNFSAAFPSDSTAVILNEAAARMMGVKDMKDVVARPLYQLMDVQSKKVQQWHVIGVMKNFNFSSLRDAVMPLGLFLSPGDWGMAVRYEAGQQANVLAEIKKTWSAFSPAEPIDYAFMDDQFNGLYTSEEQTGKLFINFAVLAIMVASLGLFGLVTFAASQRTREIGIRKVLGASVSGIALMMTREFVVLVLVASLIAFPVAWWAMNKWLQGFAYRTGVSWWIFAAAALIAVLIALVTVSYRSLKAALTDPVKSLRSE